MAAAATAAGKTAKGEQAPQVPASNQQQSSNQTMTPPLASTTSSTSSKAHSAGQQASPLPAAVNSSQLAHSAKRCEQEEAHQFISQQQSAVVVLPATQASTATKATVQTNTYSPSSMVNPDTRTHVVGELYDTERSYVESLQILVEKYMKPLKSLDSNRILIESNLVDEIFYTIPEILQHHETFLSALQDRLTSDWDTSQIIGNVFIEAFTNQQIIDTYTAFINNWKNARQAIKIATQAKPAFERYLEAMSREHRNKLTLDALLIMPVQRIPRYELLIKELIKHTPENHPDHGPLIEAQKEIHELALKIDRAEKEMIHQEQLKDLESLIEGHVELQHPQREFIRYDLVTILGASALTVAKKERVLFLFCDLLIMTSVKKKASRRSNLQTAFANSSNDLSLLEGTKFKLLLRVSLDQVEIRLGNDQIQLQQQQQQQQQQQHQEQQHHLQLQQSRIIHERKREIEADLYILHQMDSLSSKMSLPDKIKLTEVISELVGLLRQRLLSLNQIDPIQPFNGIHQTQVAQDLNTNQSPISGTGSALSMAHSNTPSSCPTTQCSLNYNQQYQAFAASPNQMTSTSSNSLPNQNHDSNTSLEFIISNGPTNSNPLKDSLSANLSSLSVTSDSIICNDQATDGQAIQAQQSLNCDALVVTFASHERRQAFLQTFIETKQQRYILQQHRQQQQRVFSSSATIRLARPNSPDRRSICTDGRQSMVQHQDNAGALLASTVNGPCIASLGSKQQCTTNNVTSRISSAPLNQKIPPAGTIIHQMSAPLSLALEAISASPNEDAADLASQCNSWSSSIGMGGNRIPHHHHQLMHQNHPASLDTICCSEIHNDATSDTRSAKRQSLQQFDRFSGLSIETIDSISDKNSRQEYTDYYQHLKELENYKTQFGNDLILILDTDNNPNLSMAPANNGHRMQLMNLMSHKLLLKSAPRFLVTMPMNFLNTQHPALQFTCSTLRHSLDDNSALTASSSEIKRQTVKDSSGQLWLCMSNGYVSHVALISVQKKWLDPNDVVRSRDQDYCCDTYTAKRCYNMLPVVQSAGDICKSHINCATQVKWFKEPIKTGGEVHLEQSKPSSNSTQIRRAGKPPDIATVDHAKARHEQPKVEIKAASPPVDIKSRPDSNIQSKVAQHRLSESAPNQNIDLEKPQMSTPSASTTRLEVPVGRAKTNTGAHVTYSKNLVQQIPASNAQDSKRSLHDTICQRHYHHGHKQLQNRLSASTPNTQHQLHHHHHHHGHHQNINNNRGTSADCHGSSHNHHHHQHSHHHHHHLYNTRHNTVPIAELRKALERQNKIHDHRSSSSDHSGGCNKLAPPTNTPADLPVSPDHQRAGSHLEAVSRKWVRSNTPPASKGFRSARKLRHQASLKTSSILAKLVSGASKHSSYLRKSTLTIDKQSDLDDNDIDADSGNVANQQDDNSSLDSTILALTTPGAAKCSSLNTSQTETSNTIISPLSSVSSLNSTNSSLTVNSMCASSPNRGSCDLLLHSLSANCCAEPLFKQMHQTKGPCYIGSSSPAPECGMRSRSATVPSRTLCHGSFDKENNVCLAAETDRKLKIRECSTTDITGHINDSGYKVSEIISDPKDLNANSNTERNVDDREIKSSLWLGCDDGSVIIINCLNNRHLQQSSDCNLCDLNQKNLNCGNQHSEIKLNAPVSDIRVYKDKTVFVALSNGQLAIFSRNNDNSEAAKDADMWSLTNPRILTITTNELNSTSKLCLIDDDYLWYSYGRNIFVLNISTLKLEITIMAPTNDLSMQFTLQSITIDNMELMSNLSGVWISFKNSHSIQLYDVKRYKLLVEINLFEPINKVLSYGNEIIRQHKTACLKATALLNFNNQRDHYNTLFIGTSAGVILYLNISHKHFTKKEDENEPQINDWNPKIASLRHGHSGQVKFLHLIEADSSELEQINTEQEVDSNNNTIMPSKPEGNEGLFLVSGGTGVDVFGPSGDQQIAPQLNSDEDSLNHLMFWQLQ